MSGPRGVARRARGTGRGSALEAGALAAALLLAAGCGSAAEPGTEVASGSPGAAPRAGSCGGLEAAAAAELLGCAEVDLASTVEDASSVHCVTSCRDDPQRGLVYSVETLSDAATAEAVLRGMRQALARTGAVTDLPGLGEDAWRTEGLVPRLAARSAATIVEVTQPPDPEIQRRAARTILDAR